MWLLVLAAGLTAAWLVAHAERRLPREHRLLTPAQIWIGFCLVFLGGLLGARLLYVIQYWEVFRHVPQEILAVWLPGKVWYGGFLGGALAGLVYLRCQHLSFLRASDHVFPFVALAHGISRIGCFFNQCCVGTPTTGWLAVQYPNAQQPVVPVQLLESAALILLYLVLRTLQRPAILGRPGLVFGIYLLGYATVRWILEFWRAGQPMIFGVWTVQQLISLGVWLAGMLLAIRWVRVRQAVAAASHDERVELSAPVGVSQ